MVEKIQCQTMIVVEGEQLEIVASEIADASWQLAVINSLGVRSIWVDFFPTPEAAFDAAKSAIEAEGVEAFLSIEGFEYLKDR
ncbi:MAG: hypothetical protein HKM98_03280 [Gammaproteobacteria bacterium]|nr:hypothetical protein [Gammaproteobacteria bacterium]